MASATQLAKMVRRMMISKGLRGRIKEWRQEQKSKYSPAPALSCPGMCGETPLAMGKQPPTRAEYQREQSDFLSCCLFLMSPGREGTGQDEMQGLDTQHMAAGEGQLWHRTYREGVQIKRLQ